MFTDNDAFCDDEAFQLLKSIKNHSETEARQSIAELDAQVQENLDAADYGEEHQIAIVILLQARNFFARFVGQEQVGLPDRFYRDGVSKPMQVSVPDQREGKHVAIYGSAQLVKTTVHVLQKTPLTKVAAQPYSSMPELLKAIEANTLLGIVSLEWSGFTESVIRHDYKNLPGKSRQEADALLLPPIADLGKPPVLLLDIATTMNAMYEGTYGTHEAFDLNAELPLLLARMVIPKGPVHIAVVDDVAEYTAGILTVLSAWKNVTTEVCSTDFTAFQPKSGTRIVLLDEDLGDTLKGATVHDQLTKSGFTGMVASITGGSKPDHVTYHFGGKTTVTKSRETAREFVAFINQLFTELEA